MQNPSTLIRKRIVNGIYEGVYKGHEGETAMPVLELGHMGKIIGEIFADTIEDQECAWLIRCKIPTEAISDGVQTFLISTADDNTLLDSFTIIAGEPLDDDLRTEISLLREELDMLKRAFRHHCVETIG